MTDGAFNPLKIHLFGTFHVAGPEGADLTPKSEKGQALLALLVTSRHHKRTRPWLQDKLWSRSDPARGAANLRQVLATLRRALGPWTEVLQADRHAVWLDPDLFATDWTDRATADASAFLEGIDVDDPEFGDWLANIRNQTPEAAPRRARPDPPGTATGRWRIALAGSAPTDGLADYLEAELLAFLARSMLETGVVEIGATPNDPLDPFAVDVSLTISRIGDARFGVRISVLRPERRRVLWSTAKVVEIAPNAVGADPQLMALVSNAQAAIIREIARESDLPPGLGDDTLILSRAAQRVFSFDAETLARTDRSLTGLQEGRDRGVVLGLRAQIAVIRDIERLTDTPEATAEQGLDFAARALEADPGNSLVLSAAANAQVFLKWDVETGAELSALALRANRANPLAWWAQANVALYTRSTEQALANARTATELAEGTPLQFWCQFQLGLAALAARQLELARRSLETSAAIAPSFRPPRRYLLALYAHLGRFDRAARMAKDLAALEETFSLDAFARDHSYPVSLARRVGLIDPQVLADLDRG